MSNMERYLHPKGVLIHGRKKGKNTKGS